MKFFHNAIVHDDQIKIVLSISRIIKLYPFYNPRIPRFNRPFKMKITSAGLWGWNSDKNGYGYISKHPITKLRWPKIPNTLISIWRKYSGEKILPNSCLFNLYNYPDSKLGLHQDKDENNFSFPVLSISIGNSAIFKYGETKKNLNKIILDSGTIVLMGGDSRLYYHGISKIIRNDKKDFFGSRIDCLPENSRICITMRRYEPSSD